MSVRTMARVWEHSAHSGTHLLMMLAIADFADDDGRAYPSVSTLAKKCRMKPRNANVILAALRASGELKVLAGQGPKGANVYRIKLDTEGVQSLAGVQERAGVQGLAPPPAKACPTPLQRLAPKPSGNHQEPPSASTKTPTSKDRLPPCPHDQIVALYHQQLPSLPRVLVMSNDRKKAIGALWKFPLTTPKPDGTPRASTAAEALQWIAEYFARASENDFVMGRTTRAAEHKNWQASLDYLASHKGLVQVIEKTRPAEARYDVEHVR